MILTVDAKYVLVKCIFKRFPENSKGSYSLVMILDFSFFFFFLGNILDRLILNRWAQIGAQMAIYYYLAKYLAINHCLWNILQSTTFLKLKFVKLKFAVELEF